MIWYYVVSRGKPGDVVVHSRHLRRDVAERKLAEKERKIREVNLERELKIVELEGYQDTWLHPMLAEKEMNHG
jgi:hypothetical protein